MFVVVENSTQTRLHLPSLVTEQDVKPNVAKLNLDMQAEEDPELLRIRQEMETKMELRRQQLQKQQELEQKRQDALRRQAEESQDAAEQSAQPIVNVGIIETVSRT